MEEGETMNVINITNIMLVNVSSIEMQVREAVRDSVGYSLILMTLSFMGLLVLDTLRRTGTITEEQHKLCFLVLVMASLFVGLSRIGFLYYGI